MIKERNIPNSNFKLHCIAVYETSLFFFSLYSCNISHSMKDFPWIRELNRSRTRQSNNRNMTRQSEMIKQILTRFDNINIRCSTEHICRNGMVMVIDYYAIESCDSLLYFIFIWDSQSPPPFIHPLWCF